MNDALYREMTAITWSDPTLAAHRRFVGEHHLGYDDPAFHAARALPSLGLTNIFNVGDNRVYERARPTTHS